MLEVGTTAYDWVMALHVISVIAWMAGLLYLPRLFVYHCQAQTGSATSETFKVMERRLLRAIMNPAMIESWVFGGGMYVSMEAWTEGWAHATLLFAVLVHGRTHGHGEVAAPLRR